MDYSFSKEGLNIWLVCSSIIFSCGLIGNCFSISLILILKEWKNCVFNSYILQLAIADSILLLTLPFTMHEVKTGWDFSLFFCYIHQISLFFNYYASVFFLMVISLDRFIAICSIRSESLAKLREPIKVRIIIFMVWLLAFTACLPLYFLSDLKIEDKKCVF